MNSKTTDSRMPVLLALLTVGLVSRVSLLFMGRTAPEDGFYALSAFRLGQGDTPYLDFTHVAFPTLEWLYSPLFSTGLDPVAMSSLLTAAAVITTSILIGFLLQKPCGNLPAILAGTLYLISAPIIAFHQFEREIWTNLGLVAAAFVLLCNETPGGRRAAGGGLLLALTLTFKLTAAVGAIALLLELLCRRHIRTASISFAFLGFGLIAATLMGVALWNGAFVSQVFLFYFFRGDASSLGERLIGLGEHVDPTLAIGLVGVGCIFIYHFRPLRFASLLMCLWVGYYLLLSSSMWNHNMIDLALPAALGGGYLCSRLILKPRPALVMCTILALVGGARGLGPANPSWFPHGFGGSADEMIRDQAALIQKHSKPGDLVVSALPLAGVLAGRKSFVSDIELEPVARGLFVEWNERGLTSALKARNTKAGLGSPGRSTSTEMPGSLFEARVLENTRLHIIPRLLDAIMNREIAVLAVDAVPPAVAKALREAGYQRIQEDGASGYRRG